MPRAPKWNKMSVLSRSRLRYTQDSQRQPGFFGIVVRMFYDDHPPPHVHVEYQGKKAKLDFMGNVLLGDLGSRTALRLVRDWIDLHTPLLERDWQLASESRPLAKIAPLE